MFDLTMKKGVKKYTVATWTGGPEMCLDMAWHVFREHGFMGNAEWHSSVIKQKCYGGRLQNCVDLTDSPEQAMYYHRKRIIGDYLRMGKTPEYIIYMYPEWESEVKDLTKA